MKTTRFSIKLRSLKLLAILVPPTINLENPEIETKIDLVPKQARERKVVRALSNSFGFGGTNASLVLGKLN